MDPQALELNAVIEKAAPGVFELLSDKGRKVYFPKKGILAQTAEAKGKKINATIGEAVEDDGLPMRLPSIEKGMNISSAQAFPYAPSTGKPDIRAKWKEMMLIKNPTLKNKGMSLPLVTSALTHGLSIAGYMFINPGDTLLVPDLYWENYNLIFENAYEANIKKFTLFNNGGLNLKALDDSLMEGKPGKKILLLNFPNNPAGYTPTVEEAKGIIKCIEKAALAGHKLVVVIDDAYFGLVYEEGIEHESLFSWLADLHQNVLAVKLDGPTKEDYVWGFRVGFITYGIKGGNADLYGALEAKTAGAIRGNVSSVSHPAQTLLLQAYSTPSYEQEKKVKYDLLKTRFQAVKRVVHKTEYVSVFQAIPFNSGYFMCVRLAEGIDAEKVRKLLLSDFDTGIINMAGVLRIAFSCVQEAKVPELFENIYQAAVRVRDGK